MEDFERPTWAEINLTAIQNNAKKILDYTKATKMIAVIKANAYGHGDVEVAKALEEIGVFDFAVATVDEGVKLRKQIGPKSTISLLGVQPIESVQTMLAYDLAPAVGDLEWLEAAHAQIQDGKQLKLQLAIDTGMGRIGARSVAEFQPIFDLANSSEKFEILGVFTHFATADDKQYDYFKKQRDKYLEIVTSCEVPKHLWHLANSGTSLWHKDEVPIHTLRVGSVLYGYNPSVNELTMPIELEEVFSLKTKIGASRLLKKGCSISYGATYTAQKDQWVATLPIGYADGYIRRLQGMKVIVDGTVQKVIGRVTMDQILISLDREVNVGSPVTLIGKDQDLKISLEEFSDYIGTIPHEVLTNVGARVPRVYVKK